MESENKHSKATEALIVVSQTVFFIVLFVFIKSYLLDNFGIMNDEESLKKNALQIGAIYFSIIVFISVIMIPLYHYEYAIIVIIGVIISISVIIFQDIAKTLRGENKHKNNSKNEEKQNNYITQKQTVSNKLVTGLEF